MQKVKIVTHSGSDLPFETARELGIVMLPDLVVFGNEQYRNNVDIFPEEFYERIDRSEVFPTSAHPSLAEFMEAFRSAGDYEEILCIVMSSQMTSTINTAKIASQMLEEEGFGPRVHVYDSQQVSWGLGLAVMKAARMAQEGADSMQIMAFLDELVPRIGVYFVMQSLKYAHKGGRIGAIKAVTADTLGVKPLLRFRDGTVSDISLNRRFSDGLQAIFRKYKAYAGDDPEVLIFHACNEPDAKRLKNMIESYNPNAKVTIHWVGPVVGIYTGVGCVGISFQEKKR